MSNYGLTKDGFKRKPYTAILEEMQSRAKILFGENINLSEKNPLGKFIQIISWRESELWEVAENVYYSAYIDDAENRQLDGIIKYIAMSRKGTEKSKGHIIASGDEGTRIDTDLIIGTKEGINFSPIKPYTLGTEPTKIDIECLEEGEAGNVSVNTITEVITPIAGLSGVTNPEPTEGGRDIEEDVEVKERYYRSLSKPGGASVPAVEGALLNVLNIKDVFVEENDTLSEIDGIPPKSIAPYVYGGEDEEIAEAILEKKAAGIRSFGTTEVVLADEKGKNQIIGFTRATTKPVYVKVTVTKNNRYPFDGDELIKDAIIKYIGGLDASGTEHRGLRFDKDVVANKLIGVADIDGVDNLNVHLSLDGVDYSTNAYHIDIKKSEKAITDASKVVIVSD